MPIDSSRQRRAPRPAPAAPRTTAGVVVVGRHRHQAGDVEAAGPEGVDQAAATVAGEAAALLRLLAQVHLHQHPGARRPPGDLGAELGPVDRLPARDPRRERAHLVALELPEEVPARGDRRRAGHRGLGEQLLGPVLAEVGDPGVDDRLRPAPASTVLVAATRVTVAGVAPGAGRRRRRSAPAPRRRGPRRRRASVSAHGVRTTTTRLATGDAVAPVREVVGRRGGAHVDVVDGRRPRPARARPRTAAGMSSAGAPVVGARRDLGTRAGRPAGRGDRSRTRSARGGRTARAPRGPGRRDRTRSAATAAPITPCSRPGHPAWTTPTASRRDQRDRGRSRR